MVKGPTDVMPATVFGGCNVILHHSQQITKRLVDKGPMPITKEYQFACQGAQGPGPERPLCKTRKLGPIVCFETCNISYYKILMR